MTANPSDLVLAYLPVADASDPLERLQLADLLEEAGRQEDADRLRQGELCVFRGSLVEVFRDEPQGLGAAVL